MLAANVFAPNVSRNQPHQPGGKMKSQPYWTRQVVASMGVQAMCGFILQAQWEKSMQVELVSFGIDLFDLEDEVQGAAKGFSREVDGLAYGGWTFRLTTFYLDIGEPFGIAFPLYEVPPDQLDRRRDDCGGTDCQTHGMFLLSMRSLQLFVERSD